MAEAGDGDSSDQGRVVRNWSSVPWLRRPSGGWNHEADGQEVVASERSHDCGHRLLVDVFRHPTFTAEAAHDAIAFARRTQQNPAIWTQLGISRPEARRLAVDAGLVYVEERCIMVDHEFAQRGWEMPRT